MSHWIGVAYFCDAFLLDGGRSLLSATIRLGTPSAYASVSLWVGDKLLVNEVISGEWAALPKLSITQMKGGDKGRERARTCLRANKCLLDAISVAVLKTLSRLAAIPPLTGVTCGGVRVFYKRYGIYTVIYTAFKTCRYACFKCGIYTVHVRYACFKCSIRTVHVRYVGFKCSICTVHAR